MRSTAPSISVEAVIQALGISKEKRAGNEQIVNCPFCSTKEKQRAKMYINLEKKVFICHRCHASGSIVDLWALMTHTDTKTAYKQVINLNNNPDIIISSPELVSEPKRATPKELHQVYTEFLENLYLNKKHEKNLLDRGMSPSYLRYFKSLPESPHTRWEICRDLGKKYNLGNIPGFIRKTSKKGDKYWDCISQGLLIPARNLEGEIVSCQVRTGGDPKYIFFSYAGQLKSSAHIIPGEGTPWIIEGLLKSYVAHSFLKTPCIGIPGTNTYKTVPVEALRGGKVILAYDQEDNLHTVEAKAKATKYLEDNGLYVIHASWNPKLGKGIDDACYSLKKQGKKITPEMFIPGI